MKKTSLPSRPVFQPSTLTSTPSPEPEYHPVSAESASTSPETHVACSPRPQSDGPPRRSAERGSPAGSSVGSLSGSGASTEQRGQSLGESHAGAVGGDYTFGMAEPATRSPAGDDAPPYDPVAVDRAYLQERARRRARIERSRARRRAGLRFWFVLLTLIAVSVLLTLTIWREVERLFGL